MSINYFDGQRGAPGSLIAGTDPSGNARKFVIPAVVIANDSGAATGTSANPLVVQQASGTATAGTNLSGTATTTSGGFNLTANANRKPGDVQGQNVGTVNIGFNEFNGTAAIGSAGTYTVTPGQTFAITTTNQVNFICASGTCPVTITSV